VRSPSFKSHGEPTSDRGCDSKIPAMARRFRSLSPSSGVGLEGCANLFEASGKLDPGLAARWSVVMRTLKFTIQAYWLHVWEIAAGLTLKGYFGLRPLVPHFFVLFAGKHFCFLLLFPLDHPKKTTKHREDGPVHMLLSSQVASAMF